MKIKGTITFITVLLMAFSVQSQDRETYWKLAKIYREDNTPFRGLTADAMQQMLDYNFHFIRKGDSLYFELPTKFKLSMQEFKSLSQLNISGKPYYEMYGQSFRNDTFRIQFRDNLIIWER